jgi:hypothetical protein
VGTQTIDRLSQNPKNGVSLDISSAVLGRGGRIFCRFVTGDETWVQFVTTEKKEQSKQWMHTHSPNKHKKFKQTPSNKKMLATVFKDRKGILLTEFMAPGTTITSEVSSKHGGWGGSMTSVT